MRNLSVAAAAVVAVCLGGAAFAGESANSSFNWSGFYAGGQIGHSWADSDPYYDWSATERYAWSSQPNGIAVGFYSGMNFQVSRNVVLGVEGDVAWRDQSDSGNPIYYNGAYYPGVEGYTHLNWSVGVRGRIGYAIDRLLPYVTIGVVGQNVKVGYGWDTGGNSTTETLVGLTLGAGLEYAITSNVIARLDYRYASFDKNTTFSGDEKTTPSKIDMDTHDLFLGVAYKF